MNNEERKQLTITNEIKQDVGNFWSDYKEEHNIESNIKLLLFDTRYLASVTIEEVIQMVLQEYKDATSIYRYPKKEIEL